MISVLDYQAIFGLVLGLCVVICASDVFKSL